MYTNEQIEVALSVDRNDAVSLLKEKSWNTYNNIRETLVHIAKTQKLSKDCIQFVFVCNNPKGVCFHPQSNIPLTYEVA